MTTDLHDAASPDNLTDALRRHGVLSAGRVREVTADAPRDTMLCTRPVEAAESTVELAAWMWAVA